MAISSPDFTARAAFAGTLTIGAVDGQIAGDGAFSGADSRLSQTITAGTFKQETESVTVNGTSWSRKSPGPWLEDPKKPASSNSLSEILRTLVGVTDLGLETRGGKPLHHLQMAGGGAVPAAAIGIDAPTAKNGKATLDFYATEDGSPAVMAISGSWTQVSGTVEVPCTMAFDITFSAVGTPQTIDPPTDVWERYTSKNLGYTMAHPSDWTVQTTKKEDTYVLNDQGYVYVAKTPFSGTQAKFVAALKASYKTQLGVAPASETASTLGGEPAVRLIYEYTNDSGQDVTIADDVISRKGTGWEVFIATGGGTEDIDVFDQFVATFQFAS
jgi:hypothetical protein